MTSIGVLLICNSSATREGIKRLVYAYAKSLNPVNIPDYKNFKFEYHEKHLNAPCTGAQNAQMVAQNAFLNQDNKLNCVFAVSFVDRTVPANKDAVALKLADFKKMKAAGYPYDKTYLQSLTSSTNAKPNKYWFIAGKLTY